MVVKTIWPQGGRWLGLELAEGQLYGMAAGYCFLTWLVAYVVATSHEMSCPTVLSCYITAVISIGCAMGTHDPIERRHFLYATCATYGLLLNLVQGLSSNYPIQRFLALWLLQLCTHNCMQGLFFEQLSYIVTLLPVPGGVWFLFRAYVLRSVKEVTPESSPSLKKLVPLWLASLLCILVIVMHWVRPSTDRVTARALANIIYQAAMQEDATPPPDNAGSSSLASVNSPPQSTPSDFQMTV